LSEGGNILLELEGENVLEKLSWGKVSEGKSVQMRELSVPLPNE